MAGSLNLRFTLVLLLVYRVGTAPVSSNQPDPICSSAQLVAPGQSSLVYKYETEVKLSVANSAFDIKNEIKADVNIKNLGSCNYAIQLRNVKITETNDENKYEVTSTTSAQKELENLVVRFRWIDGFVVAVEADESAKVDHVNFIKGILSTLQVYSPVSTDGENLVREEDVLGVCTTRYKYSGKGAEINIVKNKDLSTCSRDKLHFSSSPVLTSLLGPIIEEVFTSKTKYICQTQIRDKKVQKVKCKTIESDPDVESKPSTDDSSSEEDDDIDFNDKDDDEISSKLVSIKQKLELQSATNVNIDANALKNPVRQTLQFVPTASFDKSNEAVSALVSKIQGLLDSKNWNQFAAAQFVEITNELRRVDKADLNAFKSNADIKKLVPTFLNTIYAHDPSASLLNFDPTTLKFANPFSVFYLDNPSKELVDQIVQASNRLTAEQVPEFVGLAATILKAYKHRETNNKDAKNKIKEFQKSISKFLNNPSKDKYEALTATLSAYAQLGLYDDQIESIAANDQLPLEVQYHALNAIRHICEHNVDDDKELKIRTNLQKLLLKKLQNQSNKNAVRIWAFEALYTSFIYNPETDDSSLADDLEKALSDLLDEQLNQVNGFIWSVLKYSALDRLCPLRGLAARLRVHHENKKQFLEQATLSSRHIEIELPLKKNYEAVVQLCVVFENDRAVPSFIGAKLAFDGIRRETLRLPWFDVALIIENLDWNVAEYFLKLDPLNKNKNVDDDFREQAKQNLPAGAKKLQDKHDEKEEDPDPSVHLYLKLFGADIRSHDVTDKVQDILRDNLRTFIRNQILNKFKDLAGKNPVYRLPLEIGAASAAANGLTLYRSAQFGFVMDLSADFKNTRDSEGNGLFKLTSHSAMSFSLTFQREIASPLTSLGETIQVGALNNVPFEYSAEANKNGRTREFNLLNPQSTLLATDFQYSVRTTKGLKLIANPNNDNLDPSCTPSMIYRSLGIQACLNLNPYRSIQFGSRPTYPITVNLIKDPSIKNWRIGWRFNAADAPQYEVAVEKVGVKDTYPGIGISATKTGNNFDIKVLTGMKSFNVKGTQMGNKFDGKIYSNENKEVMTTSGTLTITNDAFQLDSKLVDSMSKKEVLQLKTNILANRGKGLVADIDLATPDKSRSFQIHFHGDLYKPDSKLFHIDGQFQLAEVSYNGKVHLERSDAMTRIELRRSMKFNKNSAPNGYDFVYERKSNPSKTQQNHNINSHLSLRAPNQNQPVNLFEFKTEFIRANDLSNATLSSSLDFLILTRQPPVHERFEFDYVRKSVRTNSASKRLLSPEANLKIQVKSKSNIFNFLLAHRHRKSSEGSKKGPQTLPPTFDLANKIHIAVDTDKLLPDIPRPFAFDVLSDLDFELLNKVDYKFQYDLRRRQRSAVFTYHSQVDKITDNHIFYGTSKSELQWDNKEKKATATGNFAICTYSRTLKTHWDIDTNIVPDKNDIQLDFNARFDRQPKKVSPESFIGIYNLTIKAPKHQAFQLIDLEGNLTKQQRTFQTYNSIAYRVDKSLKEYNLNLVFNRNQTGDGSLQTHIALSFPFKNLPYITHDLNLARASPNGRVNLIESKLLAKPVFAHYGRVNIDRSQNTNQPPCVQLANEVEYLRANGDSLHALSKVDVHRWSKLHSFGLFKRNNDVLHKHSIGYIFSNKTKKVALSLESPQLSGNPLSIIAELTIDRENRIGKLKWPQEFGVHLEFGTPLSNLTALHVFYNLPMFNKNADRKVDGAFGFKLASPKITPISIYGHAKGSLNTSLHISESIHIGNDIALTTLLTAQYLPQSVNQISLSTATKFYNLEFQNSLYALVKKHQFIVRGVINTTNNKDYKYEMDIGYDDELLTGHTERTDGEQTIVSDIDAKKCSATGIYARCYKGDIMIRTGLTGTGSKGTFDISLGRGSVKLEAKIPNQIELKLDHSHTGRIRDEDFSSKTNIDGKFLQNNGKGSFSYSGSVEKEDGQWNNLQVKSSVTDSQTGQPLLATDVRFNQNAINKLSGDFQRKINVQFQRQGQTVIDWSSQSNKCKDNPTNVLNGICQTTAFTLKASNQLAQRLRQRLELPVDPKLSDPTGQVNYDGTLNLDLKFDPKTGPHKVTLYLNRLKEDAVDLDASFQPRYDDQPMNIRVKANLPRTNPISVKYDETRKSPTNFQGVLKYSFNANEASAEKTYQCEVDRPDVSDFSLNCKGERTTLTIDIDRKAGLSKVYVDLNRFEGERIGYEGVKNPQTNEFDATLYTLVTSWNIKRQPGKSTTVVVKQKTKEVFRVEGTKISNQEIQVKFSPSNVNLKLEWDNSTVVTLKQTAPQTRNLLSLTIDRAQIRPYLPSLRNQNRPSQDIDEMSSKSSKPLVELALDSHILVSVSQALDKLGSHNGLFGLETIKKAFKLQIGDALLTVYNTQHWKTHREHSQLPESYAVRIINNANGNFIQLSTNKWNEQRLISKISHSFDGGKTLVDDLKLNRNYAYQVGSMYFFHSEGYRNIQGAKQLRNYTRNFVIGHLVKDFNQTNLVGLIKAFRQRLRTIIDVDYQALKDVVDSWNKESEKSFLRQWSARLGLNEFFAKYPTYSQASDRISAILYARSFEREQFWRERIASIVQDNRLKDLSTRFQARRSALIKRLLERAEQVLDRLLPKTDQSEIDQRIADYVQKLVASFEQLSTQNTARWKAIFKAIDDASKGDENKWFRTLVANIDSNAFATAADAETTKAMKKLSASSKLFIGNLQKISRGITQRREAIRERVKHAIRHLPNAFINDTSFEVLVPLGRRPGSYVGTSELSLGLGSLLRNRDQAFDTIRSILQNRLQSRSETYSNYYKALRTLAKRLFKRHPSLAPEYQAILTESGDGLDVHGDYIYLNPACSYLLAHDFADLQFSFRSINGKIHTILPTQGEIKEFECSTTGRVQVCNHGSFYSLNVPMYYGGRVSGALGDVRDRSGKGHNNLNRWLVQDCPAATRDPPKKSQQTIFECASEDDNKEKFCENFVEKGIKEGKDKRVLLIQALQARETVV